jgi:IPT/TIG domain
MRRPTKITRQASPQNETDGPITPLSGPLAGGTTVGLYSFPELIPDGNTYIANLSTKSAAAVPTGAACGSTAQSVDASTDGNYIGFGSPPCIYTAANATYNAEPFPYGNTNEYGIAISGDANVVFANDILGDVNLNMLGAIARPTPFYGNTVTADPLTPLLYPRLNASGSLYYVPYPNYFEIIDVQHATLRMRFSLTETIQDTAAPLAIDSGGRFVYLLTDKGLTVVDLGAAPLSIGHLSQATAPAGTQVTVRGSGFDSGTTATVGEVAAVVSFTDENTLTLTIPAVSSGPQDIVLTRTDGESYTLENGIVVQ